MSLIDRRKCALFMVLFAFVDAMDVKVFKQGAGKNAIEMVDETQFKNPEVSTFDDEIMKKIDFSDEYDELVPKLPRYEVHQYGKNIGYTLVPIVTRSKPYWSTPMPRILLEKTWSTPDAIRKMTKASKPFRATTPLPRTSPDEELLPPDNDQQPKKHRLSGGNRRPPTSEFLSSNGRHVISTTSDGTPVEIIMAPQQVKQTMQARPSDFARSNQVRLLPGQHRASSNGGWSWSRSWHIGPDGKRVESFTSTGNVPQNRLPQNRQNPSSTTETEKPSTSSVDTTVRPTTISSNAKCRVLEAVADGKPAPDNDSTCKLLYPGYPIDSNKCKCTFHVNGRDEQGCAIGFLYSCKPTATLIDEQ